MLCRNCDKVLPADSAFCPYCGAKQEAALTCPKCGSPVLEGALFCLKCGTHIAEENNTSEMGLSIGQSGNEPFYKKWIAEHRALAETKRITWISEFKGNYAVAVDDTAPGRELRPFLVRGENTAETVCYMSWTGANLSNGVVEGSGDCFRNGTRYLSFILFKSNSMVSPTEYRNILTAFTGITQAYATSGVVLLLSRTGKVLFASQYQENVTGIADIFPLRVIGERYCLYTSPTEYNKMTERERYSATSDDIKTASQQIVDCDTGRSVLADVFVPKYDGDPSGYFAEYFSYTDKILDKVLHVHSARDRQRCIFNRKTGLLYSADDTVRYKTVRITGSEAPEGYLLLRMSDIRTCAGLRGETESAAFEFIDGNDTVVTALGRYDIENTPEIVESGGRLYLTVRSPETRDDNGSTGCANNITDIYCFEVTAEGKYERKGAGRLKSGGGFMDGIVHIHTDDGKTGSCYGAFSFRGRTLISVLKERSDPSDEYDQCLLLNDDLKVIYGFNYKPHYGDQCPYGIHIFDNVMYSLSSEEDEYGDTKAVMKNIVTKEIVFSADPSQLISNANAEFGKNHICPRYEFGGYRVGGKPCFLVGKQNRKLGIMDLNGRTIIPADADNYFIASGAALGTIGEGTHYARLPADTFLIVLGGFDSDRYRVCGADSGTLFEGTMAELVQKYE
ncbi:MAG: zinc ribbon domain-containing protein [Ruminiclostridium sp.]|nr:zinc ribbon domain-containing protein [Ruminiclostridium sp.]